MQYIHKNESKHSKMGPVRQNPIQRTVRSVHNMCASHSAQLLHTMLHRTDLIIFPLTLQTITIALMMSIWGKRADTVQGCTYWRHLANTTEPIVYGGDAAYIKLLWLLVTFLVRHSRGEMYIGHGRLCACVCLRVCLSVPRRIPTLLHSAQTRR